MPPRLKETLKRLIPFRFINFYRELKNSFKDGKYLSNNDLNRPDVFDKIYKEKLWVGGESRSGGGSNLRNTEDIRKLMPDIIKRHQVTSLLDLPCGDLYWIKHVDLSHINYIGGDIVVDIIDNNQKTFGGEDRSFRVLDIRHDALPKVDLILCRDCLIHLSFRDCKKAIDNIISSEITFLLTSTHPSITENLPIKTGDHRLVNLLLPPFSFPEPIEIHRDRYPPLPGEELINPKKSIALWRVEDLAAAADRYLSVSRPL